MPASPDLAGLRMNIELQTKHKEGVKIDERISYSGNSQYFMRREKIAAREVIFGKTDIYML